MLEQGIVDIAPGVGGDARDALCTRPLNRRDAHFVPTVVRDASLHLHKLECAVAPVDRAIGFDVRVMALRMEARGLVVALELAFVVTGKAVPVPVGPDR